MKIKVIDEIMSSGKSHWMLNKMKQWEAEDRYDQFFYISPLLSEVGGEILKDSKGKELSPRQYLKGRVQETLPHMNFTFPRPIKGSKAYHVSQLIHQCKNVSATHKLFLSLDTGDVEILKQNKNVLIIDEAIEAYEVYKGITKQALDNHIKSGILLVDEDTRKLSYNHEQYPIKKETTQWELSELVKYCDNNCVYYIEGNVVLWEFPTDLLRAFDDVYVLTYIFEGSFMYYWCKINGIEIEYVKPELYRSTEEVKSYIKELINVVETPSIHRIEDYSYSQSWWEHEAVKDCIEDIKKALSSCVTRVVKCKTEDILITCPKLSWQHDKENKKIKKRLLIKGRGYSRATWLASETRATNDYRDKTTLIYLLGKYPNPMVRNFCASKGYPINREKFALASFLQWIFRGSIRKGEPMNVIMPSKAMRLLLKEWLKSD
jgi:hypothetical protein